MISDEEYSDWIWGTAGCAIIWVIGHGLGHIWGAGDWGTFLKARIVEGDETVVEGLQEFHEQIEQDHASGY